MDVDARKTVRPNSVPSEWYSPSTLAIFCASKQVWKNACCHYNATSGGQWDNPVFNKKQKDCKMQDTAKILFAEFLESCPPNQFIEISDLTCEQSVQSGYIQAVSQPAIQLHCNHELCNGTRFFRCISLPIKLGNDSIRDVFLSYRCANCQKTTKLFSFRAQTDDSGYSGTALKYGEYPPYGPPTSPKLLKLIGPDRELFLKGRRCENQGLGVGAFVYYRRVIENQKDRILSEVKKVLETLNAPPATIETINNAINEVQFSKAMDIAHPTIPEALFIDGHNPLKLVYRALSDGIHNHSDEHCLEQAASIRIVLGELSDRIAQALKNEAELTHALNKLLNPN